MSRFWPDLLEEDSWKARLEKLRGGDMQEIYGCDGKCKQMEMRISELGGLSRLKKFEGGTEVLNKRKTAKSGLEEKLWEHVSSQHGSRKYPILSKLQGLKDMVSRTEVEGVNTESLSEKHLLNKTSVGEIDRACQMMVNTNELHRRVGLLCVTADEPQPPDFTTMSGAGEMANDIRPWDVRVQEVLRQELLAEKEALEEERKEEEKKEPEERKEEEKEASYSQYGIEFDWLGTAKGTSKLGKFIHEGWRRGKSFGLLWVDGGDKGWGLDVLLGFEVRGKKVFVITHELRPRKDGRCWSLDSEFVPKCHGDTERQMRVKSAQTVNRYWDSKCMVKRRGLEWCGQLILEPFPWDSVRSDTRGKFVTVPLEQRLELRNTYRPSVCWHTFGMSVTREEVRKNEIEIC